LFGDFFDKFSTFGCYSTFPVIFSMHFSETSDSLIDYNCQLGIDLGILETFPKLPRISERRFDRSRGITAHGLEIQAEG
jgi:hypothetical protein